MNKLIMSMILLSFIGIALKLHLNNNNIPNNNISITNSISKKYELPNTNIENIPNYNINNSIEISEYSDIKCANNTNEEIPCNAQNFISQEDSKINIQNCSILCTNDETCKKFMYLELNEPINNNTKFCQLFENSIYESEPPINKFKFITSYDKI